MKINAFKKTVDNKVKKAALKYLLSKQKSKGKEIVYVNKLECQGYLLCEMKYLIEILNENQKKHELYTHAQDINLSSHY